MEFWDTKLGKLVKIAERKLDLKRKWEWTKETAVLTKEVLSENKEVAGAAALALFGLGSGMYKTHARRVRKKEEADARASNYYDRSMGENVELLRPMTIDEHREFEERAKVRKETGETYFEIFDSMGLVKR